MNRVEAACHLQVLTLNLLEAFPAMEFFPDQVGYALSILHGEFGCLAGTLSYGNSQRGRHMVALSVHTRLDARHWGYFCPPG